MSTILIVGQNGQVSQYLQETLSDHYTLHVSTREELDLTDIASIQAFLKVLSPSVIINPAAYTAVDNAEKETELAFTINRDAVREIAEYAAMSNTPLIHYSTDYVFDGESEKPYLEQDRPAPSSVYGQSKYEGEQVIIESGAPAIILRTAWVYSNKGKNFYKTMLALAQTREELSIVGDQFGSPTYAGSIAEATKEILDLIVKQGGIESSQVGIYHLTCQGSTSWHDFAQRIFALNKCDHIKLNSIPSSEYPTPAKRPMFSVLDGSKLDSVFGVSLPQWQDALDDCVVAQSNFSNANH